MNIFTTDHPLSSDSTEHQERSALASVLSVATMLFPFLLGLIWFTNLFPDVETTDYSPDPFWQVLVSAMVVSLVVAFVGVALYRLTACILGKSRANHTSKRLFGPTSHSSRQ